MYPVSNDFFEQTKEDTQEVFLRGTIDGSLTFTKEAVKKGTYSITAQCTESTKVKIGTAYTKTLKMVLFHTVTVPRGTWQGRKIFIEEGQEINGVIEWCPMGYFFVSQGVWTPSGISITAYDAMMNFDKLLDFDNISGTPYEILSSACTACDVEFGMTQAEVEALPNGNTTLGAQELTFETYRDYIASVATALGGFVEVYRDGKLYVRTYHQTVDDEISPTERFENPSFSDYVSFFSQIAVTNETDGETVVYVGAQGDGLTMELGANPFLQLGTDETIRLHRQAVADAVANINYTPFSATVLSSPYYDLTDVIRFTDGIAENCLSCVMQITYKLGKVVLVGYGENPALQTAQSKYDKAISGRTKTSGDTIVYHTFINPGEINVGQTWTLIGTLGFAVKSNTCVEMWHELLLDLSSECDIELRYVYNGSEEPYFPKTHFSESGRHLLGTQYWKISAGQSVHTWVVFARVSSGTATIEPNHVHILLKGQGLVSSDMWDGTLTIEEEFEPFFVNIGLPSLTESVSLTTQGPTPITITQEITPFSMNIGLPTLSEDAHLVATDVIFTLVDEEDEDAITQEDDGEITTEGGYL